MLVDKDYWIMHCLWGLQAQGFCFELKGGTSVSKGFGIIPHPSPSAQRRAIVSLALSCMLPSNWSGEVRDPMQIKTDAKSPWSFPLDERPWSKTLFLLCVVVLFNSLVGISFWASSRDNPLLGYLIVSNGIGFSATLLMTLARRVFRGRFLLLTVSIAAPLSVVIGVELGAWTFGGIASLIERTSVHTWLRYGSSFVVVYAVSIAVTLSIQAARMRESLETQRREAAELRQSETAARLALLQAQIEPHFLFNTLANVQSLIQRDPPRAGSMLESLNRYLRASLARTRKPSSTLSEELDLVEALLNIASIRLGSRLRYEIEVPQPLRSLTFAPLLLQPLVENAIVHGIEPSIEGGDIRIVGMRDHDHLVLDVTDTGAGLGESARVHGGVGLANVRDRLRQLYGGRGQLSVVANANTARGVTARLQIPIA